MEIENLANPEIAQIFKDAMNHLIVKVGEVDEHYAAKVRTLYDQTRHEDSHDRLITEISVLATEEDRSTSEIFWETYGDGFMPTFCVSCKKHRIMVTTYFRARGAVDICSGFCLLCSKPTSSIRSRYLIPEAKAERARLLQLKKLQTEEEKAKKKSERALASEEAKLQKRKAKAELKARGGKEPKKTKQAKQVIHVSTKEGLSEGQKPKKRQRSENTADEENAMVLIRSLAEKFNLDVSVQ